MKRLSSILAHCCLFLLFYLLPAPDNYAQAPNTLLPKLNIPTSPEASLLGKFGDIPVGYYTGTADISVPLYTIKEGAVEIPLVLRYHSSGIKVEDQATWVGLGWDMTPGGAIVQEVRGVRDESDNGLHYDANTPNGPYGQFMNRVTNAPPYCWNKGLSQIGYAFYNVCSNTLNCPKWPLGQEGDDAIEVVGSLLAGHGQPDIYHFEFAGYRGKFYIHPETGQVVQLDKKTELYFTVAPLGISITTLDGTIFYFNAIETAYELGFYAHSQRAGKTYKLTSIQFLNNKSITFEYADAHYIDFNYSEEAVMNNVDPAGPGGPPQLNTRQSDIKILTRITTADTRIDFNLAEREDFIANTNNVNNVKRLTSIDITSLANNKKIRSFVFGQTYFPYNLHSTSFQRGNQPQLINSNEAAFGKRLKLDDVKEIGYTNDGTPVETKPAYTFQYDMTNTMPLKISFAKDFWGYYNGVEGNTRLLPDLDQFDYPSEYLEVTNDQDFVYSYQNGANRLANNQRSGAYMLQKITYPTGGYSEFTYEPNSFANQLLPDASVNLVRSYRAEDHSIGGVQTTTFTLTKKTRIRLENRINNGMGNYNNVPPLTYNQMAPGCYIRLSRVKTVNGVSMPTLLQQWDLSEVLAVDFANNGGKVWNVDMMIEYDPDPTTVYRLEVNFPDNLNNPQFASIAGVTAHVRYYDNIATHITESKQAGVRIRHIKNYTESGVLASNKLITYTGGKLLSKFWPIEMLDNCHYFQCIVDPFDPENCPQITFGGAYNRLILNTDNLIRESGPSVGYDQVEEKELVNDNAVNGKKVFRYYNFENSEDHRFQVIVHGLNGLPSDEMVYNAAGDKITEKTYQYTNLASSAPCYYSISINQHFFGTTDPYERATPGNRYKYSYNCSPLITDWYKVQQETTKYHSNGLISSITNAFTYNTEGSVSTVTTTNSKKESIITKFYYPLDNMIGSYVDATMTAQHNTGTPVITEKYKASTLLSRETHEFGQVTGAPTLMPQYTYTQKGNNPEQLKVTIDRYDDKGNVLQYTQTNNIPVSIVYNADKTLPIAKVENATYASLLALPNGLNSDFRASLPNARVTTYTYKPLVGVATITDVNNKTSYYEYDAYGRLLVVKDQDGAIIKTYDYHYKQ